MAKVDFTEVNSDSLISNKIVAQDSDTTLNKEELGITDDTDTDSIVHVYIVFTDGVSIDQGIGIIEETICNDTSLQVSRRDEGSNAIVAVVSGSEAKSIEKLDEVSFIKIDTGAQKTTESNNTNNTTNNTTIEETETTSAELSEVIEEENELEKTEEIEEAEETLSSSEVQENNLDTNVKTVSPVPIFVAVILGVAILIGIILHKANR
ncbi:hypothetical protein SAMN05421493_101180 [Pseudobutyrivibrio sp. 49]|uniref:hypothetical protein n=1 Tax=Pseudobutyrivibrio sp. 49 TaxID=1855344 RepID=UPI00088E7E7A|nr:hypothetical protein [Pseudobutyrivibrio sp. 49]SDH29843.1 hypothetical protein SAMN05421493_101180 [Pseudobutyrivibrio sp. 49]